MEPFSHRHRMRTAVEAQDGRVDADRRRSAVDELGALCLPVDAPGGMKAESDPYGTDPLPSGALLGP